MDQVMGKVSSAGLRKQIGDLEMGHPLEMDEKMSDKSQACKRSFCLKSIRKIIRCFLIYSILAIFCFQFWTTFIEKINDNNFNKILNYLLLKLSQNANNISLIENFTVNSTSGILD